MKPTFYINLALMSSRGENIGTVLKYYEFKICHAVAATLGV
ncbi:hypothetical protein HMPREF1139_1204 [Campylobacter sp. FOBRC14]|nr:hypothetical protein HMPREF1139_1204 [Campylobacter sp. FOBRC14]